MDDAGRQASQREHFVLVQNAGLVFDLPFQEEGVILQVLAVVVAGFGPFQCDGQRLTVQRLGNKIRSVQLKGPDGQVHLPESRGHDHFGFGMGLLDLFQDGDAVHARHAHVRDDDLRRGFIAKGQAALAVFRRVNGIAGVFEGDPRHTPNTFLVINQNNAPTVVCRHTRILACRWFFRRRRMAPSPRRVWTGGRAVACLRPAPRHTFTDRCLKAI